MPYEDRILQLKDVFAFRRAEGSKISLLDAWESVGGMDREQALSVMGEWFGMETALLSFYPVDLEAVAMLPKEIARKDTAVAIRFEEGRLYVAIADPLNYETVNEVKTAVDVPVVLVLADDREIVEVIESSYSETDAKRAALLMHQELPVAEVKKETEDYAENTALVVKLLNNLLLKGYTSNASDIHIEPFDKETVIRMRVDGMLLHYVNLPGSSHQALIARVKIMSGLDIAEKRIPQDGHCRAALDGQELNLRVSIIPTVHGEKAVLRFLTFSGNIAHKEQFGMDTENADRFKRMLQYPHGIIYLTGPTGSGKTTTLYMALAYLAQGPVNISTIEDPVERSLSGISQIQVNPAAGVTFESGLRALLRQDPDVMMVGETRDNETARISARAALTGHLVLSTLHTNDAVSAIIRLRDMGLADYLISNAVIGIVAQRLVKRLCPKCSVEYDAEEEDCRLLKVSAARLRRPVGCQLCGQVGYKGRMAVHELFMLDREMRRMVMDRVSADTMHRYAVEHQHMCSLGESMSRLVLSGLVSMEEYRKINCELEFLYES